MKTKTKAGTRVEQFFDEGELYKLRARQYRAMIEAGILDDELVELRNGLLVLKQAPPGCPLPDSVYRLSVKQYHQMIRPGILVEGDPIELIEGFLVQKMSKNPPHRVACGLVRDALQQLLPPGWHLDAEGVITTRASEPEPDVSVVRGERRAYRQRHPSPKDLALAVEVTDSRLKYDQTVKKSLYARSRVPVYWIVNLVDCQIEVYSNPTGPARNPDYRQRQDYLPEDEVPVVLDGRAVGKVKVKDVLP